MPKTISKQHIFYGKQNALVIKGDGGEFEYRPEADSRLYLIHNHTMQQEQWPRYFSEPQPAEPAGS